MYKEEIRVCVHCNSEFLGNRTRKYCSYKCSHAARQRRTTHICPKCGKKFERQIWNTTAKYCSYKCKYESTMSDILEIKCTNCKKVFKRKAHNINFNGNNFCCRECLIAYNRGSNHYEWKEDLHDKHINLALKQWGVKVKERDNYTCQNCGENNKHLLEAHHIIFKSINPDLMFNLDNGITLCLKCHYEKHIDDSRSSRLIKYKLDNYDKDKNNSHP